jgi:hypothetical protein
MRSNQEALMVIAETAADSSQDIYQRRTDLAGLPKSVRFLGDGARQNALPSVMARAICEFEVVKGNAAYRQGERFYLTPAQAESAYFSGRRGA